MNNSPFLACTRRRRHFPLVSSPSFVVHFDLIVSPRVCIGAAAEAWAAAMLNGGCDSVNREDTSTTQCPPSSDSASDCRYLLLPSRSHMNAFMCADCRVRHFLKNPKNKIYDRMEISLKSKKCVSWAHMENEFTFITINYRWRWCWFRKPILMDVNIWFSNSSFLMAARETSEYHTRWVRKHVLYSYVEDTEENKFNDKRELSDDWR